VYAVTAFRGKNLRSGDLAEQLGLLLLQNLALVAPVPRTEDVGIDAVVTLLREHDSSRFIASDSFFVQIKSASVSTIEYKDEQVAWLFGLELPFFIATVDQTLQGIELYCCHRLTDAFISKSNRSKLVIHLESEDDPNDFIEEDEEDVYVGPPVLQWSVENMRDDEIRTLFFTVCHAHVQIAHGAREMRRIGWSPRVAWDTNDPPVEGGWVSSCQSPPGSEIQSTADLMMPYVSKMLDESFRARDTEWLHALRRLADEYITVIEGMSRSQQPDGGSDEHDDSPEPDPSEPHDEGT